MRIAIHGKEFDSSQIGVVKGILNKIKHHIPDIVIAEHFNNYLKSAGISFEKPVYNRQNGLDDVDFMFTLGGDGTILDAVNHIGSKQIPIIGVNIGRLGFLATIGTDQLDYAIDNVKLGNFSLDKRALLKLEDPDNLFDGAAFALNDFTILKNYSASMITVHAYVDDAFLNSYWADGLIISTPTGSTGYSLSCGGPLVVPRSNNFIINPVSPHNLGVRPMVVADDSVLRFEVDSRVESVLVTLDSRSVTVPASTELIVCKEDFNACLVKFAGHNPFETLRQKLYWGQDARN